MDDSQSTPVGRAQDLAPGELLGRYVLLARAGAGGMGVVYAAYDPELDRKVALKLIGETGRGEAEEQRLVREARAMARLSHPNVVTVHDVGRHPRGVFMAMEFVEGTTLTEHLRPLGDGADNVDTVLRVFCAAGRGLAAAHAAGLVHRDFKPDNVMVGADGRVRVMDFGLVRADADAVVPPVAKPGADAEITGRHRATPMDDPLTQAGTVMGTPAYMAPEQHLAVATDARTDQFSFCVALYCALYGQRPFQADTVAALVIAMTGDELLAQRSRSTIPAFLFGVLARGLRSEPGARWPSMDALLAALAHDPARVRRRRLAVGAGVGVTALGLLGIAAAFPRAPQPCTAMDDARDGVWDEGRQNELRQAFAQSTAGHAEATGVLVAERLDAYTQAWAEHKQSACLATVNGEQSEALLDIRMACYDQHLARTDDAIAVLLGDGDPHLDRAAEVVGDLPPLEACADTQALGAAYPPPTDPDDATAAMELDRQLERVTTLSRAGLQKESHALLDEVFPDAVALDYPPVSAKAWLGRGYADSIRLGAEAAEPTFEKAYEISLEHGLSATGSRAGAALASVVGQSLKRPADGERWGRHGLAIATAAGDERNRAFALNNLGHVARSRGDYDEARQLYQAAYESKLELLGPAHRDVAAALANLARIERKTKHPEAARELFERALAITEAALGPEHPANGDILDSLATVATERKDYASTRDYLTRALRIWEHAKGPDDVYVVRARYRLAGLANRQGAYAEAAAGYTRILEIVERVGPGPRMLGRGAVLAGLGRVRSSQGNTQEARRLQEAAVAEFDKADAHNDASAIGRADLARTLWTDDASDEERQRATSLAQQALALLRASRTRPEKPLADLETWMKQHGVPDAAATDSVSHSP